MSYKYIFTELNPRYKISIFTTSELNFLISKELINVTGPYFKPLFVGEIITTEGSYFSLPKNFQETEENVVLFKKVLSRYKDIKGTDNKTLITNNTFSVSSTSDIKSEKFYFNELKEFFLDFVTYEYIYPKKHILKHSSSPLKGKIDVLSTIRNRKQKGPGITYNTIDIKNSEEWNIDDIYWTTIKTLSDKYSTSDDIEQINDMKDFLKSEGYILNLLDISDTKKTIKDIKKCEVGIIHQPIKNTLLDYFENISIGEKYKLNIFYTKLFQHVWEQLVRDALEESIPFRKSMESLFFRKETRDKWFPNKISANDFITKNNIKAYKFEEQTTGLRVIYDIDIKSIPDLFSDYNGKKIIGDAKYYNDPENSHFDKELRIYNQLTDNKYPMVVFVPSYRTKVLHVRREGPLELVIFNISVKEAISDAVNNTNEVIEKVHMFLYSKGYTRRI